MNENWSEQDELLFQNMSGRRTRVNAERGAALMSAAGDLNIAVRNRLAPSIEGSLPARTIEIDRLTAECLKRLAKQIRDALEPYDDGIRAGKAPKHLRPPLLAPFLPSMPPPRWPEVISYDGFKNLGWNDEQIKAAGYGSLIPKDAS